VRPVTRVAVGVLVRADGAVLLADRPAGKPYAGYWEFPGGKIEEGESVEQALARELAEELGVKVHHSTPWVVMEYDYPHAYVRLYFRRIHDWSGTPLSVEGQKLRFLLPGQAPPQPLLPAALPAMRWIQLPTITGFSPRTATSAALAVQWMENVLGRGLRQIVWHEPLLDHGQRAVALGVCTDLVRSYDARLLVDGGDVPEGAGSFLAPDALRAAAGRPASTWVGAGVQTRADLAHAHRLGCDFAVLDPPAAQGARPFGHDDLAALCDDAPMPMYLSGTLGIRGLEAAQALGVHGLAATID
jgi:8-oxo-dGTP diphosphatase